MSSGSGGGCSPCPRLGELLGEPGSLYIGRWFAFCSPPRHVGSSHCPPRPEPSDGALTTLPREERIQSCHRDAPIAAIELVTTCETAVLTPLADGGRRAVEPRRQLGHGEVGLRRLAGTLAVVLRRELQQPVPSERQRGAQREALRQLAEAIGNIHRSVSPARGRSECWIPIVTLRLSLRLAPEEQVLEHPAPLERDGRLRRGNHRAQLGNLARLEARDDPGDATLEEGAARRA